MLFPLTIAAIFFLLAGCQPAENRQPDNAPPIQGSWKLIYGVAIAGKDTTVTVDTKGQSFIKIINQDHFSFLKHDLNPPTDSSNHFDAGGGAYTLTGNQYTEHLDYYGAHKYEGKAYTFSVTVNNDTLIQQGVEKAVGAGPDHLVIEKYLRIK